MKNVKENRIMVKWRALGLGLALAVGLPAAALAQSMIQSITSSQQGGSDVVRVELSEALEGLIADIVHGRADFAAHFALARPRGPGADAASAGGA